MGLQYLLNKRARDVPEQMLDDCTIITGERLETEGEEVE